MCLISFTTECLDKLKNQLSGYSVLISLHLLLYLHVFTAEDAKWPTCKKKKITLKPSIFNKILSKAHTEINRNTKQSVLVLCMLVLHAKTTMLQVKRDYIIISYLYLLIYNIYYVQK